MDTHVHRPERTAAGQKQIPTPNMRALRLALTAGDQLLSMGKSANKVVSKMLDITDRYCEHPVHVSITYDTITISQLRGLHKEPLTLLRPVSMRAVNNMTMHAVQRLIYEIRNGQHSLDEAEVILDRILSEPRVYPAWLMPAANALIAPAVTLMFSTNWHIILLTFVIALLIDRISVSLARRSVMPFFRQIAASAFVTLAAAVAASLAQNGVGFFVGIQPTLMVVGGIFMLLSGLAIVGAFQDAIEEYYVTATARMLNVLMSTAGVVVGVLIGLYVAKKLSLGISVSPDPLRMTQPHLQIIGALLASAAYALATQTRLRAILWAGMIGGSSLGIMYAAHRAGINVIPATGIAAFFVGTAASFFSRLWQTPSSGSIAAGIIPLVPGLALYTGLMQLVNYPPGNPLFLTGVATIFTVIGTALAIAAGATFGSMLGQPLYRNITQKRNRLPFADFMRAQLRADSESGKD